MAFLISLEFLIPMALVVLILIVLLWILYSKSKKFYKKLFLEKAKYNAFKKQIEFLKNSSQGLQQDFERLNKVARAFFKEYYGFGFNLTYKELANNFKKQGKEDYFKFCNLMSDLRYSREKVSPQNVKYLVNLFDEMTKVE